MDKFRGGRDDLRLIKSEHIYPDPAEKPGRYPDAELKKIAAAFRSRGIGVPIVVRRAAFSKNERYILVSGEKIFRAALIAGSERIPCIVIGILPQMPPRDRSREQDVDFVPPKLPSKLMINDTRPFFNSIDRAVAIMKRGGYCVVCDREERPSGTVLTITVPKSPPI